jgi:hypothetical protein
MLSIPDHNHDAKFVGTVKCAALTVLTLEITSKLVRLYRSGVKTGDVVVIPVYSRVNARGSRGRFAMTPWIDYSVRIGIFISICLALSREIVLARILCLQPVIS